MTHDSELKFCTPILWCDTENILKFYFNMPIFKRAIDLTLLKKTENKK